MSISRSLRQGTLPIFVTAWLYMRRELLFVTWALMEVALLTPFYFAMMPWARFWSAGLFAAMLLVVMFVPFNLSRLMSLMNVPLARQRRWLIVGALITAVVGLRLLLYADYRPFDLGWLGEMYRHFVEARNPFSGRDILLFLLILFTWARGIGLANREVDINNLGLRLRVGGLLLAPLIIGIAGVTVPWSLAPFVLLFFFAGLMTIALGRAEQIELERSGRSFPMSPRWIGVILAASLIIIIAAAFLTALVSGESIFEIVSWLDPLWLALNFAITAFLAILGYLALPLLNAFEWFLQLVVGWLSARLAALPLGDLQPAQPEGGVTEYSELLRDLIAAAQGQGIITRLPVIILGILLFLLIVFSLERMYRRSRGFADQAGAPLTVGLDDAASGLQRPGLAERMRNRLAQLRNWRAAASIRRIYQQMSRAAAAYGYGRQESETPFEYLSTLTRAWPEETAATRLITNAYVRIRYGEFPETRQELDEIRAAWDRLEKLRPVEQETTDEHG